MPHKLLCVAMHTHAYGVDAHLFYVSAGMMMPEDEDIQRTLNIAYEQGEGFDTAFVANQPAIELTDIHLVISWKAKN